MINELRQALAAHDEFPTPVTRARVIDVARRLIQTIDQRAAVIEMMRHETPTDQAIRDVLGTPL